MTDAARLDFDEHFVRLGLRLLDVFDGQRGFELVQDGGFHRAHLGESGMWDSRSSRKRVELLWLLCDQKGICRGVLRLCAAQEKFNGITHSLGEFVRSRKIHCPLADYGIEKSFHKFGQMHNWKIPRDLPIFLALRDNLAQKADRRRLGSP